MVTPVRFPVRKRPSDQQSEMVVGWSGSAGGPGPAAVAERLWRLDPPKPPMCLSLNSCGQKRSKVRSSSGQVKVSASLPERVMKSLSEIVASEGDDQF